MLHFGLRGVTKGDDGQGVLVEFVSNSELEAWKTKHSLADAEEAKPEEQEEDPELVYSPSSRKRAAAALALGPGPSLEMTARRWPLTSGPCVAPGRGAGCIAAFVC